MRLARGIIWARRGPEWPPGMPRPRPRRGSAKAAGLAYEKSLAEALPGSQHGVWWEWEDSNGHGWCQTDLVIEGQNSILVIEVKYSWVPEAREKLLGLYVPVVAHATGKRVMGVVVVKRLTPETEGKVTNYMTDAVRFALGGGIPTLHWLGGPLVGDLGNGRGQAQLTFARV